MKILNIKKDKSGRVIQIWERQRIKKYCLICNKEFETVESRIKRGLGKFCSRKCYDKSRIGRKHSIETKKKITESRIGHKNPNWKGGMIKKECLYCNKIYFVWLCRKNTSNWCSKKCVRKYRINDFMGEKNPMYGKVGKDCPWWKGGLPKCLDCNKELTNYCSKYCSVCSKVGERSPNWRGGITPLNFGIRNCMKYKDNLIQSKQRDNFQCLMPNCDSNCKILHSHHIEEFSKILEENNIKTLEEAENCQKLWDINNLSTLCKPCHKHIRGKEEQFENLFNSIINNLYKYNNCPKCNK